MASYHYTPLRELPTCSDDTSLSSPQEIVELEAISHPQSNLTVRGITNRRVTACCMLCSILNYLCVCCPCLGIPALIFAILGTEAEKRGDLKAAKSHAFHLKIFNIIYAVECICCMITTSLCLTIGLIIYFVITVQFRDTYNLNDAYNYVYSFIINEYYGYNY